MKQTETICVDIGNSGMRCVRLHAGAGQIAGDPNQSPWVGTVLRVDWQSPLASSAEPSPSDSESFRQTLRTTLSDWLTNGSADSTDRSRRWLVSSVQRTMESNLQSTVMELSQSRDVYRAITFKDLDLEVEVDFPERVGIDRLLAASAAAECTQVRPLIVVQAGSAITVDLVEAPRRFVGGAILPGVPMMLRLLSRAADLLPEVAANELLELPPLPGKNTSAAMSAGVSSAVVGGAQHLIGRYRQRYGASTPVILSGGDGPRLTPHLTPPIQVVEHLVLRGLAAVA